MVYITLEIKNCRACPFYIAYEIHENMHQDVRCKKGVDIEHSLEMKIPINCPLNQEKSKNIIYTLEEKF